MNSLLFIIFLVIPITPMQEVSVMKWQPPVYNEDGSLYTNPGGYRITCGLERGTYNESADVGDVVWVFIREVAIPSDGWQYCDVRAYNMAAVYSLPSEEVRFYRRGLRFFKELPTVPRPPNYMKLAEKEKMRRRYR